MSTSPLEDLGQEEREVAEALLPFNRALQHHIHVVHIVQARHGLLHMLGAEDLHDEVIQDLDKAEAEVVRGVRALWN